MNATDERDNLQPLFDDKRMSFDAAWRHVIQGGGAAFAVHPVFEEDDDAAPAGARVFVLAADGRGGCMLRFVAGRFFSGAYAADDLLAADEIPERVRELRFLPTRYDESWFTDQLQVLIGKLTAATGTPAPHMPDYQNTPQRHAAAEVVFPMAFIKEAKRPK